MADEDLRFSVDSQLLGELGERLVTQNYIALAELIKNAYDADAKSITIHFVNAKRHDINKDTSEIRLEDTGNGMTFQEIHDYWMRIATDNKARQPISPRYGRRKTGNKGVGRFACRRLAKKLIIESTAFIKEEGQYEFTRVYFNWLDFKPGTILSTIPCKYETRKVLSGKPGVILRLIDLNDTWTDHQFNLMRRQVLSLSVMGQTKRDGYEEDLGFAVELEAPEFLEGEGFLVDQFMDAGWGKIDGTIKSDGTANIVLNAKDIEESRYAIPEAYPELAGISFEIAWIPIKKEHLRNPKILTKKNIKEIMLEQGGIRVYLDGFRVYPYGEPQNDWLEIDKDVARRFGAPDEIFKSVGNKFGLDLSRTMLLHPRNSNLVGRVHISSDKTSSLAIKLDREGFIESKAFFSLKRVIRLALQWMVLYYNKFTSRTAEKKVEDANEEFKLALSTIQYHRQDDPVSVLSKPNSREPSIVPSMGSYFSRTVNRKNEPLASAVTVISRQALRSIETLPPEDQNSSKDLLESALNVITQSLNRNEIYCSNLSSVASTGIILFAYAHEIKGIIGKLTTHANTIERLLPSLPEEEQREFEIFAGSMRKTQQRFEKQLKLFFNMASMTSDIEVKPVSIEKTAQEVIECFDYLFDYYQFDTPEVDIADFVRTKPMRETELFSILINLVSNAIKAVIASDYGKKIKIQAFRDQNSLTIRVFDDGIGLSEENFKTVFEKYSPDPEDKLYKALQKKIQDNDLFILGRGSGIGLSIVKQFVENNGGSVQFVPVNAPWKTCVEVKLP